MADRTLADPPVTGFNHTGIVVDDLEKMERFYTEILGLQVLRRIDSIAPPGGDHTAVAGARRRLVFVGLESDHQIELIRYDHPPAPPGHQRQHQMGTMHVCFDVADLKRTCKRLEAQGVSLLTEPKFRRINGQSVGVVYARDPEGNWLEFIEGLS